jgi:ATP-dependent Zn protease
VNEAALLAVRGGCAAVATEHFEAAVAKQLAYQSTPSVGNHNADSRNMPFRGFDGGGVD